MFICKNCKNKDKFELMPSSAYNGKNILQKNYDDKNALEITIDEYSFIPDLQFMNQHAVCRYCGQTYIWEYE